jgi:predicted transcriptional regulator
MQYTDHSTSLTLTVGTGGVRKGRAVKLDAGQAVAFSSATDLLAGVAAHDAAAGEQVAIVRVGEVDVEAPDATIAPLDLLTTNSVGQFVKQLASGSQVAPTRAVALVPGTAAVGSRVGYRRVYLDLFGLPAVGGG